MDTRQGSSAIADAQAAVREATERFEPGFDPDVVFAFVSVLQDTREVARALVERFPRALIVGCTTAGEILDGQRTTNSLALSALRTPSVRWAAHLLRGIRQTPEVERTVAELCAELGCDREAYALNTYFAMTLIDGLSVREEVVGAALAEAFAGIPIIGGSAGDGLQFEETRVFVGSNVETNAAVLLLAHAEHGFELFKHQHYLPKPTLLAVTKADVTARRVDELDGRPAAETYAAAIGVRTEDLLDPAQNVTFMHPVTFSCGGEPYVRSVRAVEPNGAMHFYCAVEEGMVLEVSGREDMDQALARSVEAHVQAHGQAEVFVGFNCILRALEMEQLKANDALAAHWSRLAKHSIGFDTYGEMWNGLHINQTLVGVTLREPRILPLAQE